jgi:outer membrane protein assembly factor BamB
MSWDWTHKHWQKRAVTRIVCLWMVTIFLAGSISASGMDTDRSAVVMPSSTMTPRQDTTPTLAPPTAAPSTVTVVPSILPGDWPSFLLGKGGFNDNETAITTATAPSLTRSWTAHAGGGISSEPVVVDGTIFWGSWDGYEHATSVSGQARWSTFLGSMSSSQCYPTTAGVASTATVMPVERNGKTTLVDFVGGGNARVFALNAATGNVLWSTALGSANGTFIWDSPVLYQGHLYIGTASVGECPGTAGYFFQLNSTTGAIERVLNLVPPGCLGGGVWGSPTLDADNDELYFTTSNGSTCGIDEPYAMSMVEVHAATLTIVGSWQVPASEAAYDGDFGSTPVLFTGRVNGASRGLVGAVNKNGIFYAFERGKISQGPLWRNQISTPLDGCSRCPSGDVGTATWDGSRLYVGSTSTTIAGKSCYGSVRELDPATGASRWQHCLSTAYRVMAPLIVVPGLVVVAAGPSFFVLDGTDGTTLFAYQDAAKDSTFDGAATIAHGVLYLGNLDGTLFAFNPAR